MQIESTHPLCHSTAKIVGIGGGLKIGHEMAEELSLSHRHFQVLKLFVLFERDSGREREAKTVVRPSAVAIGQPPAFSHPSSKFRGVRKITMEMEGRTDGRTSECRSRMDVAARFASFCYGSFQI